MPTFISLPAEIHEAIFTSCPTVATAARLSRTCHTLQDVWHNRQEAIALEILPAQIPGYYHGERLARMECGPDAKLCVLVSRLLQNARLADEVLLSWESYMAGKTSHEREFLRRRAYPQTCVWSSYYIIRQLVNRPEPLPGQADFTDPASWGRAFNETGRRQREEYEAICKGPPGRVLEEVEMDTRLSLYMFEDMDVELQRRHGVLKEEEDEDRPLFSNKGGLEAREFWFLATYTTRGMDITMFETADLPGTVPPL